MESYWIWITLIVLILGTLGTLLPFLPGLPIMAVAVIAYGWAEGFQDINIIVIIITLGLTIFGSLFDYIAGPYAANRLGATKAGVWGALLGSIGGIFIMGPIGLILGPFVGAIIGELLFGKELTQAARIGVGSMLGMALANILKFVFGLVIIFLFIIRVVL